MDNNEYPNVLACCKKYGFVLFPVFPVFSPSPSNLQCVVSHFSDKDSNLWVLVLSYFAEKDDDCQKEISEILNNILFILFSISFFSSSSLWQTSLTRPVLTYRQEKSDAPTSGDPNPVPEQSRHPLCCEGLHHEADPERKPDGGRGLQADQKVSGGNGKNALRNRGAENEVRRTLFLSFFV